MKPLAFYALLSTIPEGKPIVVLQDPTTKFVFLFEVGATEATLINYASMGKRLPRPMPADQVLNMARRVPADYKGGIITKHDGLAYHARGFYVDSKGVEFVEDTRPSDVVYLSLMQKQPIYISEELWDMVAAPLSGDEVRFENWKLQAFVESDSFFKGFRKES